MQELNTDENFSSSRKTAVLCQIDPVNVASAKFKELAVGYLNTPTSYKKVARRIMLSHVEEIIDELEKELK